MKTKILLFALLAIQGISFAQLPYNVVNATAGNLNIRAAQPCTTATIAATLATNSHLVASNTVSNSCGYNWFEVDIPLTATPTIPYYGADGTNFLVQTTSNYVEVTNNVPNGLLIRDNPGSSSNILWIGNNHAAMWWIPSSSRGQRLAYTGAPVQMVGSDLWIQIYLPNNYCTVGQGGPFIQTGWVSNGQGQPDGPYLNYLPTMINEIRHENSISLFPNPSTGKFQISVDNLKTEQIKILNSLGEVIYESAVNASNLEIDLSDQAKGIYFCQFVMQGGMSEVKKIVLQ